MSTAIWPPIPAERLEEEQATSQARELEWLLVELQDALQALKAGLEECAALLAPRDLGSTLVLTSVRSESLKGFVTRNGTRIVKGDIKLRLYSLPPSQNSPSYDISISSAPQAPTLVIQQLTAVKTLINTCLDVVDVSTWTGDPKNANFIAGQLWLLHDNIQEARQALKGHDGVPSWWECPVDEKTFDPELPPGLSFHLYIFDAALQVEIRTLELHAPSDSISGYSLRDRLAVALGARAEPTHDEANELFTYRNNEVKVKEKIKIETQDPNLIAAMAKLNALEHSVALSRKALGIVMGRNDEDS